MVMATIAGKAVPLAVCGSAEEAGEIVLQLVGHMMQSNVPVVDLDPGEEEGEGA